MSSSISIRDQIYSSKNLQIDFAFVISFRGNHVGPGSQYTLEISEVCKAREEIQALYETLLPLLSQLEKSGKEEYNTTPPEGLQKAVFLCKEYDEKKVALLLLLQQKR